MALLKAAIKVGRGHLDKIEHVDSHPEERLHRSRWNRNDEGNFIADRVAVGDLEQLKEYNIELIVTSTYEVLESLSEIQTWFILSSSGVGNLCPLENLCRKLKVVSTWRQEMFKGQKNLTNKSTRQALGEQDTLPCSFHLGNGC